MKTNGRMNTPEISAGKIIGRIAVALLGSRKGTLAVATYLGLGVAGLPLFA